MADEKKPIQTAGSNSKTAEQLVFLLAGLALLGAITTALLNFVGNAGFSAPNILWGKITEYFFQNIWPIWKLVAMIVSVSALAGIIHNTRKLRAINIEEKKIYSPTITDSVSGGEGIIQIKNEKWERVMKYTNSNNASDWRLAIIEADVMLEELLRAAGHVGESIGDMLKLAHKNEFSTIDEAWEAHKVRNTIAHAGGDFQLTERETKRVISLYEKVFKEFQII